MYVNDYAETLKFMGYKENVTPDWYVYTKLENDIFKVCVILFNDFNTKVQSKKNLMSIRSIIDEDPVLVPFPNKREYLFIILVSSKKFFRHIGRELNALQIAENGTYKATINTDVFKTEIKALQKSREFESSMNKEMSYDALYGYKSAIVNYIVMITCIVLFIKGVSPEKYGASYDLIRRSGHYQNLLTANFLHAGILHLLGNLIILAFIGIPLERRFGHFKYLLLVLTSAVFASLISVSSFFIGGHPQTVTVGLSGVVFAVLAADVVYGLSYGERIGGSVFLILLNILFGSMNPTINNTAHIAGLAYGAWFMGLSVIIEKTKANKLSAYIYKEKIKRITRGSN